MQIKICWMIVFYLIINKFQDNIANINNINKAVEIQMNEILVKK